jgi:hypothetical protein
MAHNQWHTGDEEWHASPAADGHPSGGPERLRHFA